MLVISRYIGESIVIGDDVRVTILSSGNKRTGKIRIGITAPINITVHREEVYEKIKHENIDSNSNDCMDK